MSHSFIVYLIGAGDLALEELQHDGGIGHLGVGLAVAEVEVKTQVTTVTHVASPSSSDLPRFVLLLATADVVNQGGS